MKKSILLFWPYFPPDPGAASARGAAFYKYLTDYFSVSVITKDNKKKSVYEVPGNVFRFSSRPSFLPWLFLSHLRKIQKMIPEKPDIILSSFPDILWSFYAYIYARSVSAPLVLDVRDMPLSRNFFHLLVTHILFRIIILYAKHVFVTTDLQKDVLMKKFKVRNEKIKVVPNGVDTQGLPPPAPLEKRKKDVVFLGSVNPERDIDGLVELISELFALDKNINISFIGIDKKNIHTNIFLEILKKKRLFRNIEIHEEISHRSAFSIMSKSKVGIVSIADDPRLDYQFPVKVYEYMAAGLVVAGLVRRKENTVYDFARQYEFGCISDSPKDAAKNIVEILRDHPKGVRISERNIESAKNFERMNILRNIEDLFSKICQ